MSSSKKNYLKHKDAILSLCCNSACFECLVRDVCKSLCRERKIDVTKQLPPCKEAWVIWADKEE